MHRLKGLFKKSAASVAPPIAAQFRPANACPRSISLHNEPPLLDSLSWMNDASSASVRRYVQAENAYTAHVVRDRLAPLANRLQREITDLHRCHLPTATRTPAERIGVFEYFSEQCDSESPRLCRRRINQRNSEQIVIDPVDVKQRWARDSEFFHVAQQKLSSDHRYVAFTFDALGTERYRVRIRDVQTGQYLNDFQDDKIDIGSVEWASKAGAPPVLLYTGLLL
jgi:oligopeptidase B